MALADTSPFSLGTEDVVLALSVITAFAYLLLVRHPPSYLRMAFKTLSTSLLALLAHLRGQSPLLVAALALGSLGDAFLAWDGDAAFLRGLASFLVGHALYIVFFVRLGGGLERLKEDSTRAVLSTVMAVVAPVNTAVLLPKVGPSLRLPVGLYSGVIFGMVLAALTSESEMVVQGALLFTTSDAVLAAEKFLVPTQSVMRPGMQYGVWVLYYVGQLMITLGF